MAEKKPVPLKISASTMPKDFTTDIISFKHISASKYKNRSSKEGSMKERKKGKKQKCHLKYIFVEMMNETIITNKIALKLLVLVVR